MMVITLRKISLFGHVARKTAKKKFVGIFVGNNNEKRTLHMVLCTRFRVAAICRARLIASVSGRSEQLSNIGRGQYLDG